MKVLLALGFLIFLSACTQSDAAFFKTTSNKNSQQATDPIRLNQLGFAVDSPKIAVVVSENESTENESTTHFQIINANSGEIAARSELSDSNTWELSGERVKLADFSKFKTPGEYTLRIDGDPTVDSPVFSIGHGVFEDAHKAVLKAYYFNRASTALEPQYAGVWARELGHPDTQVVVTKKAASADRPEGSVISAAKGWYDAGDYNKYVVNSGISTYILLAAYEHFSDFYAGLDLNIPESRNALPDILDEIKWNLDWLLAMQDSDGGVYHKLTHEHFSKRVLPSQATEKRYVVEKSTAASLNYAAVMAVASRVFAKYDQLMPGLAEQYRRAAISAYSWAKAEPNAIYRQTFSNTGAYRDSELSDEFSWAAAELFILTKNKKYWADFASKTKKMTLPVWDKVSPLGYISLSFHADSVLNADQKKHIDDAILAFADQALAQQASSAYQVPMTAKNFYWGSNVSPATYGLMALQAHRISGDKKYRNLAIAGVDYIFGRNALGYSFVTGLGDKSPKHPHHRQSAADDVVEPVPGFLVGGPNPERQDKCPNYLGKQAAKSYVDAWCSFASNEVTINWNAPLVYVLAGLLATE